MINSLNAELSPICRLLSLLAVHPIFHVSRIRVKSDNLASSRTKLYSYFNTFSPEDRVKVLEDYSVGNSKFGSLLAMEAYGGESVYLHIFVN
jgi:hypothetical protein